MKLASGICLITEDVLKLSEFYLKILQAEAELNPVHVEIPVEGGGITIYAKSAAEKDMGFDFWEYHGTGMCNTKHRLKHIYKFSKTTYAQAFAK